MFTIIAAPLAYNIGRASGNVAFSPGQTGDAPPAVSRPSHRYRMNIERQAILNFLPAWRRTFAATRRLVIAKDDRYGIGCGPAISCERFGESVSAK